MNPKVLISAKAVLAAATLWLAPPVHANEVKTSGHDPLPGETGAFALKVEPGVAFPLTDPQSERFEVGVAQTIKALWSIGKYVDLGPSMSFLALPAEPTSDPGTAWGFGAGLRLKRPHTAPDNDAAFAISPWLDADALYIRTGKLNRAGFAAALGLAVPIGEARIFWLGPFLRYQHILQGEKAGFDTHDAKVLILGLSLEVGGGVKREREVVAVPAAPPPPPPPPPSVVIKEILSCPDRDKDEVGDPVDHCPDLAGPVDNWGCPVYQKVVVKKDKLELLEKLYFARDQAVIKDVSFPVLDEVVKALNDHKDLRVQIEGHPSSEGGVRHNQTLSEKRAAAVLDYLVARGIGKERLVSKGFGSSVPIDNNATPAGREKNRRVNFIILNDGSK